MPKTKEQRIKFIQEHVNSVPLAVRRELGRLIHEAGVKLHECAQGSVIRIDFVPADTVELIYYRLKLALVAKRLDKEVEV